MPVSVVDDYLPDAARAGACYVCGAGRRDVRDDGGLRKERVVDLHQRIDYEGHLMVCETCIREAAALLGMVDPAATVAALAHLDQATAERDELRSEVAEAHQLIALIRQYDDQHPQLEAVIHGYGESDKLREPAVGVLTPLDEPPKRGPGRPRKTPKGDAA